MTQPAPARTALVVEDESLFLMEISDLLGDEGYAVLEATRADEALRRLEAADGAVTLLVTDVRMPGGMDGLALAHEVRRRWPGIAIVIVSAHAQPGPGDIPAGAVFVGRPFTATRIGEAVRKVAS